MTHSVICEQHNKYFLFQRSQITKNRRENLRFLISSVRKVALPYHKISHDVFLLWCDPKESRKRFYTFSKES